MEIIYSPWMEKFLNHVKNCEREIILVSPFIKLSLIKPLLLALPNKNISITVVTRFKKDEFRLASDLNALELLKSRPLLPGDTSIFKMNRLHAKVYIFDRKTVFLGSSNLSISGFDRNYEMAIKIEDKLIAEEIIEQLKISSALKNELFLNDFEEMYERLGSSPSPLFSEDFQITNEINENNEIEIAVLGIEDEDATDEDLIDESSLLTSEDIKERSQEIEKFLREIKHPNLNSINEIPFLSIHLQSENVDQETDYTNAKEDLKRIQNLILPNLNTKITSENISALTTPFVHRNWSEKYNEVFPYSIQNQFFANFGRRVLLFEIAKFFARQVGFNKEETSSLSIATHNSTKDISFDRFLQNKGLSILLHLNVDDVLSKQFARAQFETIIGLQSHYENYNKVQNLLTQFLEENLIIKEHTEHTYDPKTFLQNLVQIDKQTAIYYTKQVEGTSSHNPDFSCYITIGSRKFEKVEGKSKKTAEINAAIKTLNVLKSDSANLKKFKFVNESLKPRKFYKKYIISTERSKSCKELADTLQLQAPKSVVLIDIALTHISFCQEYPETRPYNRLAFVGSYLLNLKISDYCLKTIGWQDVKKATTEYGNVSVFLHEKLLKDLFDKLKLIGYFQTVQKKESISSRVKIDVIQAIFATAFYWGGMAQVNDLWERLIAPNLQNISRAEIIDAVTSLQEYYQNKLKVAPNYKIIRDPKTPTHKPLFYAECFIQDEKISEGKGTSKKEAKQSAAKAALNSIDEHN